MNFTSANIILIVVFIALMYFVMIRPQRQQDKKNQEMRSALKIGDEIVTIGGIVGKITKLSQKTVTIQTGNPNTKLEIIREAVSAVVNKEKPAEKTSEKAEEPVEETAAPSRDKKVTPKKLTKKSE